MTTKIKEIGHAVLRVSDVGTSSDWSARWGHPSISKGFVEIESAG